VAGTPDRKAGSASKKQRVQGVSTATDVTTVPTILQRIVLSNADAAKQTLTVADGGTVLTVLQQQPGTSTTHLFGIAMGTKLTVTPSSANIDALCVFD